MHTVKVVLEPQFVLTNVLFMERLNTKLNEMDNCAKLRFKAK